MGVRKTVFGSREEKRYFTKLNETWRKEFNLYHNLPFLNVFTARDELLDERGIPFNISEDEFEKLKKTSIDFTLCDKGDRPLVCIEFDGLQAGFNVGRKYRRLRDATPRKKGRRAFLELKLRVGHGSVFPYFVLGSDQFRGLSDTVRLTIADGLIGEVMSNRACGDKIYSGFKPTDFGMSEEEFNGLTSLQQSDVIGNWITEVEIECDYTHNPIFRKVAELSKKLGVYGHEFTFLNNEDLDPDEWVWIECGVGTPNHPSATSKLCLPNFKTPFCYFTVHIAMEIAHLLALEKLSKQMKNELPQRTAATETDVAPLKRKAKSSTKTWKESLAESPMRDEKKSYDYDSVSLHGSFSSTEMNQSDEALRQHRVTIIHS